MPTRDHLPLATLALIGALVISVVTVYGVVRLSDGFLRSSSNRPTVLRNDTCPAGKQPEHRVVIQNNTVVPSTLIARKCDRLTIINMDEQSRLIAFGVHEDHIPYDGVSERVLTKNESLTVSLVQTGNFIFHDHNDDVVRGAFTVEP